MHGAGQVFVVGDLDKGLGQEVFEAPVDRIGGEGAVGFEPEEFVLVDLFGDVFGCHCGGDQHIDC